MSEQRKSFAGLGLGLKRRIAKTPPGEADLVIRECRRLIDGGVFFDVGANVGEVSEALLPYASKVVAMEPDPATFDSLNQRLGDRVVCVNALIGPDGAERTFLTNTITSKCSTSVAPGDEPPGHGYLKASTVHSVSLDTIAAQHGMPRLVKIDVEGFELSVIRAAGHVLAARPYVVMEFNALCLANFGRINPRDAIDEIMRIFPVVELITAEGLSRVHDPYTFLCNNILHHSSVDNLVCSWS